MTLTGTSRLFHDDLKGFVKELEMEQNPEHAELLRFAKGQFKKMQELIQKHEGRLSADYTLKKFGHKIWLDTVKEKHKHGLDLHLTTLTKEGVLLLG